MFTIRSSGSIAQMIAEVRGIPARVIPYAASTALTRCAQRAQKVDLPAEMRRVFSNPTPYAINSLFVVAANKDTLSARVMVKNTAGRGVVPENFLFPEVAGGGRHEKGFEKALRYRGILKSGERAMPSAYIKKDKFGNVPGIAIQNILSALDSPDGSKARYSDHPTRGGRYFRSKRYSSGIWAGTRNGLLTGPRGIWQRKGRHRLDLLFVFTSNPPQYRPLFDFTAVVQKTAEDNFKNEFNTAAAAILGRSA